ncbi:MAG: polyphosphate kinase 1 [Bacteroidota bacterium]|nr:polyphosphate kinase 1 [Bacteroidota bacterium]
MKYFNRDLSWLSFNERVLQEAEDVSVPLFERIKFLAIFSSNMEEFFRVRVAFIRSLLELKRKTIKDLDFDPEELLGLIHKKVNSLHIKFGIIFKNKILYELIENNIFIKDESGLNPDQKYFAMDYFSQNVRPLINPILLVRKKLKPFLKSGTLYLAVKLSSANSKTKKRFKYALVEIPTDKLPRFIVLPSASDETNIILIDDIICIGLVSMFDGFNIEETGSVKLTRDAELYIDDEFNGSIVDKIKKNLSKRMTGVSSRFLYDEEMSKSFLKFLKDSLSLSKEDLFAGAKYHNFSDFMNFPIPFRKELEYKSLQPEVNKELSSFENILDAISVKDYLLNYPYDSFEPVVRFIEDAASDKDVKEIKITLYRVAKNSLIVKSLLNALKNGKQVVIFVEIKARFDEELNIVYAKELEEAGANIIYSIPGLKVHAKLCLVNRNEKNEIKNYCYLSTGNFNEKTAKIYSDLGLFTSDKIIAGDMEKLFKYLEKKIDAPIFDNLLVAQFNMKKSFLKLIDNEIENASKGLKALIIIKLNSLEDKKMIEKLYEANNSGVRIKIIVRGVCCLIPGIKGYSENIDAISIVDRFLEHSRIFIFYNNGKEKIYLSSADWMKRNLSRRIETAFPVKDETLKKKIKDLIKLQLEDNTKARIINKNQDNLYRSGYTELKSISNRT